MAEVRERCRHDQSLTIHPVSRGPRTMVECDICDARWEVDSGMVVLMRLILDRQDSIAARILEEDDENWSEGEEE